VGGFFVKGEEKAGGESRWRSRASPIAWVRLVTWSLLNMLLVWVLTVLMAISSARATSGLEVLLAIRCSNARRRGPAASCGR